MRIKRENLFIVTVTLMVISGFCCISQVAYPVEESFTAASGFDGSVPSSGDNEKKNEEEIDGNALFGGYVGIGTTAPQARLHIGGKPGVDGIMFPDGTVQKTAAAGSGESNWETNNSDIYNINEGNVGIGTNSPQSKLEVKGNVKAKTVNGNDVVRTQSFQVFPIPGDYIFATSSTSYTPVSKIIPGGLAPQFLPPIMGTIRFYRLKVSYTDDITDSDEVVGSNLRYFADQINTEIFNFVLKYSSASGAWIKQRISNRFRYTGSDRTLMEVRSGVEGKFLQIYGIWVIAEDVVE